MTTDTANDITVYWRPGCGFCAALLRRLEDSDLTYTKVNIWDSEEAAEFVRSVADGNETVPTVTVGSESFVNPSFKQLKAAAAS